GGAAARTPPRHGDVRVELPVPLGDDRRAGEHAPLAGDEAAGADDGPGDGRLRREIPQHAEVLVEGGGDGLAQRADGGVGVAHRTRSGSGSGTKRGSSSAANTNRPMRADDGSG